MRVNPDPYSPTRFSALIITTTTPTPHTTFSSPPIPPLKHYHHHHLPPPPPPPWTTTARRRRRPRSPAKRSRSPAGRPPTPPSGRRNPPSPRCCAATSRACPRTGSATRRPTPRQPLSRRRSPPRGNKPPWARARPPSLSFSRALSFTFSLSPSLYSASQVSLWDMPAGGAVGWLLGRERPSFKSPPTRARDFPWRQGQNGKRTATERFVAWARRHANSPRERTRLRCRHSKF